MGVSRMRLFSVRICLPVPSSIAVLAVVLLVGCAHNEEVKRNIDSPFYKIQSGSKLVLHQQLNIAAERSHVSIQQGETTTGLDNYAVGCQLEVRKLGPGVVTAGTFTVSRAESSQEWISQPNIMRFYRVIYLKSDKQPDVMNLTCQDWDGPMMGRAISVAEMREALGSIITFEFAQ
jgi:hypothetical protein